MTSSSSRQRDVIAQRAQAVMHQGISAILILDDGTRVRGRIDRMSLNGTSDPKRWDPVTVTVNGVPIALGRIVEVADKTWETQYDGSHSGAVVRFASEIHHMARSAFDPPAPDQERR